MSVVLALSLMARVAMDPTIPPPYAPPADQIAGADLSRDDAPVADDPEPEVVDDTRRVPPPATPRAYLYATYPGLARKLDCMITLESSWDPTASGAGGIYIGLAQFDRPTWLETPQGKSGYTRTDPIASIDAMAWGVGHLGYGRWPRSSRAC
jgi:hypothetical protein